MKILKIIFFPITIIAYFFIWIFRQIKRLVIKAFLKSTTISKIDALTGEDFETMCKLMFEYVGYNASLTPKSNDYGADLILNGRYKIIVQAKLYYGHSVGSHAIQEVTSALKYYKGHFAVVITNWHFSKQAKELARVQNVVLIEREDIVKLLNDVNNKTKTSRMFNLLANYKVNVEKLR